MFNLTDTVSVVIGGNGVLGSAMASALAEAGSKVAIVGRDMEKAKLVCNQINSSGGTAISLQADATKKDELEAVLNDILQWGGPCKCFRNKQPHTFF